MTSKYLEHLFKLRDRLDQSFLDSRASYREARERLNRMIVEAEKRESESEDDDS